MIRYGEEVETIFLSDEFIFTRSTLFISYIVLSAAKLAEFEIVSKILRHYYLIKHLIWLVNTLLLQHWLIGIYLICIWNNHYHLFWLVRFG